MKKEFVPLTANPQQFLQSQKNGIRTQTNLIKKKQFNRWDHIRKFEPADLQASQPEVIFVEEAGEIRQIQFKCPCGCRAKVDLIPEEQETSEPDA